MGTIYLIFAIILGLSFITGLILTIKEKQVEKKSLVNAVEPPSIPSAQVIGEVKPVPSPQVIVEAKKEPSLQAIVETKPVQTEVISSHIDEEVI